MTTDSLCPKHGTEGRELVFTSMVFGRKVYECAECEAEINQRLWNGMLQASKPGAAV